MLTTKDIRGLHCEANFLTIGDAEQLIHQIDNQPWTTQLKRRVQQYGYCFNYTQKTINPEAYLGPFPDWLQDLALKIEQVTGVLPNQAIVNEYLPGQGINLHVDAQSCFGNCITSISLLAPCTMVFENLDKTQRTEILLPARSRITMMDEARHLWRHGINRQTKERRVSITLRTHEP